MQFLVKLNKHIRYIKREMSSFKLQLWEKSVFVNFVIPPGETDHKLFVTLLLPNTKQKRLNLCRDLNDTVQTFIDRLQIKAGQIYNKRTCDAKPCSISIHVNETDVPNYYKCSDIFRENNSNITIHINEDVLNVIVNAPIINDLKLSMPPYKGFMLYPHAFIKGYNFSLMDSKYLWYRIESKNAIEVGSTITYIPTANDVNCCLKFVCNPCNEEGQFGPPAEFISSKVLENPINTYPYEKRLKRKPDNSFRVVSYNILADEYTKTKEAKAEIFKYCTPEILASSYRYPLLLNELIAYKADIICLQEVDSNFFDKELSFLLNTFTGLKGEFLRKSGRRHEGLSCFYSPDKFNFLKKFDIKLNDLDTMEKYCGSILKNILDDELWKHGLEKSTVFQGLLLELISDQKHIILVCNTHLISDPDGDSIRLLQVLVELIIINQIIKSIHVDYPQHDVSVIFCGDFNSTPESGVFDLVTKLCLLNEFNEVELLNQLKGTIKFKMESAYETDIKYSNFTQQFSGLLDYIYFTNQCLELIQVLPMPSHNDVVQHVALPSILFPSDHLPLIADFKLK